MNKILFFIFSILLTFQVALGQADKKGNEEEVEVVIGISKILQMDFIPGNIQVSSSFYRRSDCRSRGYWSSRNNS